MTIRVIITDDRPAMRAGLRAVLEADPDILVVAEANDGAQAIRLASEHGPDVVIMDVAMPTMSGIEATRQLRALSRYPKVLALSMHEDGSYIRGMLKAGASGYVLKECAAEELSGALRAIQQDELYLSPGIANNIVQEFR